MTAATALPAWVKLRCPECAAPVRPDSDAYRCDRGHLFAVRRGVPQLFAAGVVAPDPSYVRWVGSYYRTRFSDRQLEKTRRLVAEFVRVTRPATPVLDVGCGRADKAVLFPPETYVGIDPIDPIAAGMVEQLPAPVVCGRGERLPFSGAQFASVLLFGVLDHVTDREGLYRECARVLRPGGSLCILNQVPGERDRSPRAILRWAFSRLLAGDFAGIAAVGRYTFANPATRRFVRPLTAAEVVEELGAHFSTTEHWLIEDGHVLLARSVR